MTGFFPSSCRSADRPRVPLRGRSHSVRGPWSVVLLLCALMSVVQAPSLANDVYRWEFLAETNYAYSPILINVDTNPPGEARLILQSAIEYHTTIPDYSIAGSPNADLRIGADDSIRLTKESIDEYSTNGVFTSRIMYSQLGWQYLAVEASNVEHQRFPADLVSLYRMNNDNWDEAVHAGWSGWVGGGNPTFTTDAKVGSHAGYFDGGDYVTTFDNDLLNGQNAISIACWVKVINYNNFGGIVFSFQSSKFIGLRQDRSDREQVVFQLSDPSGSSATVAPLKLNRWYFYVCTWDAGTDGLARLFANGTLVGTASAPKTTPIQQSDNFLIGKYSTFLSHAIIDEVSLWKRALTSAEISQLFDDYSLLYPVRVQVRSGGSAESITNSVFVGPDGTSNSTFTVGNEDLPDSVDFNPAFPYAQYKVTMFPDSDQLVTPYLEEVGLFAYGKGVIDQAYGDFMQGELTLNTTNSYDPNGYSYLGLRPVQEGGYFTNGLFVSRVVDAGASTFWKRLSWTMAAREVNRDTPGLIALYHCENSWNDSSGNGFHAPPSGTYQFDQLAKAGLQSALFDGTYSVSIPGINQCQSIEFWFNGPDPWNPVMQLTAGTAVVVSNGMVTTVGFGSAMPDITVNGNPLARRTKAGWNHVAVVWPSPVAVSGLVVGRVGTNDYIKGFVDEVAVYDRELLSSEIKRHFQRGVRPVAGTVRFQARASDDPFFEGVEFVGATPSPDSYLYVPGGIAVDEGQYFQYRVFMDGPGDATPGVSSVEVQYGVTSVTDRVESDFIAGIFVDSQTTWWGEQLGLRDHVLVGPPNMAAGDYAFIGLWHLDEVVWGQTKEELSGALESPDGGAQPSPIARVGTHCGVFDGLDDRIILSAGPVGSSIFTLSMWINSTSTDRAALISSWKQAGESFLALEFNSDGQSQAPGRVALVLDNGSLGVRKTVASWRADLNDGRWHHVAGMRTFDQIAIYVDGELTGTEWIGLSFGVVDGSLPYLAYDGLGSYYEGLIDEVAFFSVGLTPAQIGEISGMGYNTRDVGEFISPVVDSPDITIWEDLRWLQHGRFGPPVFADNESLAAFWPFDEAAGSGVAVDASGNGNDVSVATGQGKVGKFGSSVEFDGFNDKIDVLSPTGLDAGEFTVAVWVRILSPTNTMVFDVSDGSRGYSLGTDNAGYPTFWVGDGGAGTAIKSFYPLRGWIWVHLAASYDGEEMRLYVNGTMVAAAPFLNGLPYSGNAVIAASQANDRFLEGWIDELSVFSRALDPHEIQGHYSSGVAAARVQARSWEPGVMGDFLGPGGTNDTYYVDAYNTTLRPDLPVGKHMQYRALISTEDHRYAPDLYGISGKFSAYPLSNPPISPIEDRGFDFVGNLIGFRDNVILDGPDTGVKYQCTGDRGTDPRWFYFDTDSNVLEWIEVDALGLDQYLFQANTRGEVSGSIGDLRRAYYAKSNALFRFRALIHSLGEFNTHLDWVELEASEGRIVITAPNGGETNQYAWLMGTPYDITWEFSGNVAGTVSLDYTTDGGQFWVSIDTGVSATAGRYNWRTPEVQSENCLVRIGHEQDGTIYDESDGPFHLVLRFKIVVPNGGEHWYIGETNTIVFDSPAGLSSVGLSFSGDEDWPNAVTIAENYIASSGTRSNTYVWAVQTDEPDLVSETGKVRAHVFGLFDDASDDPFIMAGAAFIAPSPGLRVNRGTTYQLQWMAAACGSNVVVEFQAAPGSSWVLIESNVMNQTGFNTYNWSVTSQPTEEARVRITSQDDPRARGISGPFTIAALVVISPNGDPNPANAEKWLNGTTHKIQWIAAGVDPFVNIQYSFDGGGSATDSWHMVRAAYPNSNQEGFTNEFDWLVPNTPSGHVLVRVEDATRPTELFDTSDFEFHIAGVAITWPNGGEEWPLGQNSVIQWLQDAVGNNAYVEFSYDGVTYSNIVGPGVELPLITGASLPYAPTLPTERALARITPVNPAPFTNIVDTSDDFFYVAGILIESPNATDRLGVEVRFPISFVAAATHAPGLLANIYYSSDGVNFDLANPIKENYVFSEDYPGRNSLNWDVERTREPSTTARIMIEAGGVTAISEQFSVKGVRFNSPAAGEVVPPGDYTIKWSTAGFPADALASVYLSFDASDTNSFTTLLGSNVLVGNLELLWNIPGSVEPTTNAALKMFITASSEGEDVGYETPSLPFVIQNLKVFAPTQGESLVLGQPYTIRWKAASAGNLIDIYYSSDGGTNYDTVAIGQAVPSSDGFNQFTWNIELDRLPSANARIKLISNSGVETESPLFMLEGIKVLRPLSTDIFVAAAGSDNFIVWEAVGDNGPYDLAYAVDGGAWNAIATAGAGSSSHNWLGGAIPPGAVSSNVQIRVAGPTYTNVSAVFRIVDRATILVSAPAPGAYWHIGDIYRVQWSKGGDMPNDFSVYLSMKPYTTTQQVTGITIAYDAGNNAYWFDWTVPDNPTQARFFIDHNDPGFPDVWGFSGEFNMVGSFALLSPNGGETLFASRPTPIVWRTRGKIREVDVYYSFTPPYQAGSWVKLNTVAIQNAYDDDDGDGVLNWVQTTWAPPLPDFAFNPNLKFRVQEHEYSAPFDSGVDGPFDDSDAPFTIRYYRIYWEVFDRGTSNMLDSLAVVDSSGWSQSGLSSIPPNKIYHDYRWGTWNTEWYKEYYFDKVILNWNSEVTGNPVSWTQRVSMLRSDVEPEVKVLANFAYWLASTNFMISAWLERGSVVLENPSECRVYVYKEQGNLLDFSLGETSEPMPLVSTSPMPNGVFWRIWDATGLSRAEVYFARVEIDFSGKTYSSGVTFELQVSAGEEIVQEILSALDQAESNLTTEITSVGSAVASFRDAAMQKLTNISDTVDEIATNMVAVTNMLGAGLADLTNQVSILDTLTNVSAAVTRLEADSASVLARMLTRPETMVYGTTNTILYKTRSGYAAAGVKFRVRSESEAVLSTIDMSEIVGGIYQCSLVANWPGASLYDTFFFECSDPLASDRISCRVVEFDVHATPGMMDDLVTGMAVVESAVTNLNAAIGGLTNLQDIADKVTDMSGTFGELSSNVVALMTVTSNLESNITGLIARVSDLDLSILSTNVQDLAGKVSNLVERIGEADLTEVQNNVSNILDVVGGIGDLSSGISNLVDNIGDIDLAEMGTNIIEILDGVGFLADATNIADNLADLAVLVTNLGDLAELRDGVTNIISKLESIEGLPEVSTNVQSLMAQMAGLTNLPSEVQRLADGLDAANLAQMQAEITSVSNMIGALGTASLPDIWKTVTNVQANVAGLGTLSSSVSNLNTALGDVSLAEMSANLTNVQAIVQGIGDMESLSSNVTALAAQMPAIAGLATTDFEALPRIESSVASAATADMLARIEERLGAADESAAASTVFGGLDSLVRQLEAIEGGVASASGQAGKAAQSAQSAKTQAADAAGAIGKLKAEIEKGNLAGALLLLHDLSESLAAAQESINGIPKGEMALAVHRSMTEMAGTMQQFAASKGYDWLLKMEEIPPGLGGKAGEPPDESMISALNANMQEMKVSMDFMQKLLDEMRFEPVVEESLIGVED